MNTAEPRLRPYVSFVLPCYNEGAVLPETYRRVKVVEIGRAHV